MARPTTNKLATRELPDTLTTDPPKGWEAKDLWPIMLEMRGKAKSQLNKIRKLEEIASQYTDPSERLMSGLGETAAAVVGGFGNPFLVAMLGEDWQKVMITEDFGIDTEAITAGLGYGIGLYMYWADVTAGKWVFEGAKGAVASYAGYIGRQWGAEMALTEGEAATA